MRRVPRFEYHAPASAGETASLLSEYGDAARLIAGGTDLLISMKHRLNTPEHLISLSSVDGLDSVDYDEKTGLRMGAGVTLSSLTQSTPIKDKYSALAAAARKVGSVQVRNIATLGGNLCLDTRCWYYNQSDYWRQSRPPCHKTGGEVCHVVEGSKRCFAVYSGDTAPILMAMGAEVKLMSGGGERVIPLGELFTGDGLRPNAVEPHEFLSEVHIPPPAVGSGTAYVKLRLREEVDFPIMGVAARVSMSDGAFGSASEGIRVVLNAVGPAPVEVKGAGEMLAGKEPGLAALEEVAQAAHESAHPQANTAGTPEYRRMMVPVLVKQALTEATAASA